MVYVANIGAYLKYARENDLEWLGDPDNIPRTKDPTLWRCAKCGSLLQTPLNKISRQPHRCGFRVSPNNFSGSVDAIATRFGLRWYGPDAKTAADIVVWFDSEGRKFVAPIDLIRRSTSAQIKGWFDLAAPP